METKFTKGEWTVNKDKTGLFINSESGMICQMNKMQPSNEANAKLIAAAPDLLKALIFCNSVLIKNGIYDVSDRIAVDKAQAAIKKATE